MSLDLSGVLIPCTTPFDPITGDVDLVGFRANVRSFMAHPVRGIVVGGSTGEAVLLDEDERVLLLEGARDLVPDDRLVIAGTGAESTRTTIRRCEVSAGKGADAVLVQPPAFYRGAMTDAALLDHYRAVAAASPDSGHPLPGAAAHEHPGVLHQSRGGARHDRQCRWDQGFEGQP